MQAAAAVVLLWSVGACNAASQAQPAGSLPQASLAASQAQIKGLSERGTQTSPFVVQTFETADDIEDKGLSKEQRRVEIRNNNASLFLAVGVLLVAALQAGLFVWQLVYMRKSLVDTGVAAEAAKKSADIAMETLYSTQRAFVTVPGVRTEYEWPEPDKPPRAFAFRFEIANKGMTPAKNLQIFLDHRLVPHVERDNQTFEWVEPKRATPIFLTPDVPITSESVPVPFEELVHVMERRKAFIIFGEMRYDDVFGKRHRTQSCWELVILSDIRKMRQDTSMPGGWRWLVYHRHNTID